MTCQICPSPCRNFTPTTRIFFVPRENTQSEFLFELINRRGCLDCEPNRSKRQSPRLFLLCTGKLSKDVRVSGLSEFRVEIVTNIIGRKVSLMKQLIIGFQLNSMWRKTRQIREGQYDGSVDGLRDPVGWSFCTREYRYSIGCQSIEEIT